MTYEGGRGEFSCGLGHCKEFRVDGHEDMTVSVGSSEGSRDNADIYAYCSDGLTAECCM